MALNDVLYDKDQQFIVELPTQSHTGTLKDIVTEPESEQGMEMHVDDRQTIVINTRRKVR